LVMLILAGWWALHLVWRTRIWVVHAWMIVVALHFLGQIDVGVIAWVALGMWQHSLGIPDGVIVGFSNGVIV
jgi:hypothetical protein